LTLLRKYLLGWVSSFLQKLRHVAQVLYLLKPARFRRATVREGATRSSLSARNVQQNASCSYRDLGADHICSTGDGTQPTPPVCDCQGPALLTPIRKLIMSSPARRQ